MDYNHLQNILAQSSSRGFVSDGAVFIQKNKEMFDRWSIINNTG